MNRRSFLRLIAGGTAGLALSGAARAKADTSRPNVLFMAVDDMNDWTALLKGYGGKVHTPNQERLARMGMSFFNAHTAAPVCCPSRTAVMLGKRPSSTGVYNNGQWWKPHIPDAVTIPACFREQSYAVAGAGKIFHHTAGNNPPYQWDEYKRLVFNDDPWFRGHKLNYPWSRHERFPKGYPYCGIKRVPHEFDWGELPGKAEADYDDARTADFAIRYIKKRHDKPFFLACGIFRPHLPWYVPKKYLDMYPLDKIVLPVVPEDDLDDIPGEGRALSRARRTDFERVKSSGKWKEAIQAYLASITFADAQIGRVLDALEASPYRDNTVIVFWSDHGWHLGEKNHWHKSTLWEEATRVPFYIAAPGVAQSGARCDQPVSLIDIYPTLLDLCGLQPRKDLDGVSLVPLLRNPTREWNRPALIEYRRGQCAVRSRHWRYIRYSDGSEELYDHRTDPNEWTNLANEPTHADIKTAHAKWVPVKWAPGAPRKNAYKFDYRTYSWINKKTKAKVSGTARTNSSQRK